MRSMAWVGRAVVEISIFHIRCSKEQFQLVAAPECVEIATYNDWFVCFFNELVEVLQLILAMAEFQRKMDDEKDN